MTNNDVLRRVRYIFDLTDKKIIAIFALGSYTTERAEISAWMKKDDDEGYKSCSDKHLAHFLNGFIAFKRGVKEGVEVVAESKLNNNIIFRKLKIALNMQSDEVLEMLSLADFRLGKSELSAFFRKKDHQHYRPCKDQVLRNYLQGVQIKVRGIAEE